MSTKTQWTRFALAAALAIGAVGGASAQSIAAVTNPVNFTFVAGRPVLPGMATPLFFNAANQRFIVTFSAECAVNAPAGNNVAWTDVDIQVRNAANAVVAVLPPTVGVTDAFCSANGTPVFDGWSMNSVTAVGGLALPAGFYRIVVAAGLNGGATGGWYGEKSLVVSR